MDVDEVLPAVEEEDGPEPTLDTFIPGRHKLEKDEILQPDQSVYEMLHHMNVTWPCLSFDVLRDGLGFGRQRYPATTYVVTGTQADVAKNNELLVMKMSSLHKTQKDDDDSDDEDEDEADNENLDEDAILEFKSIPHLGGVNRVRAQPIHGESLPPPSQPYYAASWAETGKVHIWNIRPHLESLISPGYVVDKSKNSPAFTINSHGRTEGFAMDWGSSGAANPSSLRLLTGDVHSKIYLTTSTPSGFNALSQPFTSHTSSVEDLQWSPAEPTVFASCSADQSVRIWDVRVKGRKSTMNVEHAHPSDVNVISWNRNTTYLLLSGGDEGGIKVWDLRNLKADSAQAPSPVASFSWHTAPITAIEWHPTEDSIFVASGADDQTTLWDLSVEADDEEMGEAPSNTNEVPPQLLFVHQGQKDVKEVHWHPQIPGAVLTTAADGFNVFKTISV
ncbi:WD40 repeat-like protein [Sistotremastrum niveocremeum HHB9708]|uniref:Glutamate-rich WD repeat-containing protein 1 n=1 Tax=Sistotremastrum niveocremeum HHB9708 TaxID=1314777 RepID=A0A164XF11_9AGAM|nr:WD40 repeat-like protein [Sistotremastrum niveocremeum HHB9708]